MTLLPRPALLVSLALGLASLSLASSARAGSACQADADCGAGFYCELVSAPSVGCANDGSPCDEPAPAPATSGVCREKPLSCESDAQCPAYLSCVASGGDTVGFCLDTCHAHAGGIELPTVVEKIRGITGRIDLVHANDSQGAAGSGRDRHANLGQGQIDPQTLGEVVAAADAPTVVETPGDEPDRRADVEWVEQVLQRQRRRDQALVRGRHDRPQIVLPLIIGGERGAQTGVDQPMPTP